VKVSKFSKKYATPEEKQAAEVRRDAREVRMLAVRFLGAVFARHPGFDYTPYW